mmetsp:Transcript_42070/g.83210  ORF Transcript_42070/g.83210 Transcript_42070/m.83210 type:complete len:224 (+) Transcript_42070:718-1389(+)
MRTLAFTPPNASCSSGGQSLELHSPHIDDTPGHCRNPWTGLTTSRTRTCLPPPHEAEQRDHGSHSPQTQSSWLPLLLGPFLVCPLLLLLLLLLLPSLLCASLLLLPEHGSVAQMLRSDPEPRHGSPPCSGWRTTSRTRRIRPVSQLREHRDQSAQSPQMQSTGGQGAMPQRTVSESAPRSRGGLLQPRPGCLDLEATPPPQDVVHEDQSFQSCHLQPNVKPCT